MMVSGFKKKNEFTVSFLQPAVACLAKAHVRLIQYKFYFGKFWTEVCDTFIGGIVINHDDFCINFFGSLAHRIQALLKKVFYVVVNYDNG